MFRPPSESAELTHSQTQIWVGQRLHPESPLYNMAFAFVVAGELRADLFARAWQRVADASDALRTRVIEHEGAGRRVVAASGAPIEILDLSARPHPEAEFRAWCLERCARPLPLADSLVDSVLVRLGKERTGWYLNQHHLISDAWSTQLLYRQVAAEYASLLATDAPEPQSLLPYYPTVEALGSPGIGRRAALEHWTSRRERTGRRVPLYGCKAEPLGTASNRLMLELDESRTRALRDLVRQEGFLSLSDELSQLALFATLLSSWLHRASGERYLGFDVPVAGRPTGEAKRALGLFIEMFPFATAVEPGDSFRTLGARCLAEAKLMLRHGFPGMSSPSSAAASNIVLNYFPHAFGDFAGRPTAVEWLHPGHGDSVHALRLQVHDFSGHGRLTLHFDGNEGALPEPFRRRSMKHFERLLDACVADPDRPIASVDMLLDEERRALAAIHSTEAPALPNRSVVAMFDERADSEPDRVALRQGSAEVSFGDLRERSEALAATLVEHGLEPGDRVVVFSRRSIHAVVAILATLRARGAYVPVEPSVPRARLEHVLRDCGARVLLLGDVAGETQTPDGLAVIPVPDGIAAGARSKLELAGPELGDLAYLMYTSGSTGRPKGVLIEHGGLSDYLTWAARRYVREDRLSFPLFTSLAFDLTVTSLFLPLITGGTLEIYPEPAGPVDTALLEVMRADAVDFIKLTPSHLSLLARVGLEGSRIRRMVVGGENLPTALARAVSAQLQDLVELDNEYGPTEAVVGCVAHRYEPEADTGPSVPIGVPADHVEVEILDQARRPVPQGTPGELWISRYGLARGYHGLDELTAERFEPHPRRPGERRYRTGDRVRLGEGGKLEFLGRLDRQVKVSGFRVELAEIEAVLLSIPGVEQCAVVARSRPTAPPRATAVPRYCARCGLSSEFPRATFDDSDVCSICRSYVSIKERAQAYFRTMDDLRELFAESARAHDAQYDCLLLYSGGKDSTYALCRLVEMGLSVYAFTLDNGFISERAKDNIRKVTDQLGVPLELATTPAMNDIFRDSLMRFSNVCQGCFKTMYTLSMSRAHELGIPIVVTGLSRGQLFETRLTEQMFRDGRTPEEVDAAVLAARKVYHRVHDQVWRSLDVALFEDDTIFEKVRFVDFYRYADVGLDEVYSFLQRRVPWVRPEDTGRSTNCLINDVGIWVHKRERGFHNYALPYSWDVRLGHKDRDAALEELDDEIDVDYVRATLAEIGYDEQRSLAGEDQITLNGFYVASGEVSDEELRRLLGEHLPPQLIPTRLERVGTIPLTASGKVDEPALVRDALGRLAETPYRAPEGPVGEYLAGLWQQQLGAERVGADDSFFELGGTSLAAMEVMLGLCREFDLDLALDTLFTHPTLGALARVAEDRILADAAELGDG